MLPAPLNYQETSADTLVNENAKCPVCKTEVSEKDIVPLYGPSLTTKHSIDEVIPPRPPTPRHRGYRRLAPSPLALPGYEDITMENVVVWSPTIGMLGEMVSGRILGDLGTPLFGTPNSYNLVTVTRRQRLQTTQADRSLSRICSRWND
ncbi:hypothetical protein L1987_58086 [Smallanthus sonchifolius]|uniref:Uncharacterized protein n=1 Tax=Smallanthus sonchifolius TaxID=185202 RepID=A0ACB9DFC1_9ASTR|nr:hypothetical protein L1987_58086 [Smallanthus sonchifolius]